MAEIGGMDLTRPTHRCSRANSGPILFLTHPSPFVRGCRKPRLQTWL